ncbi:MAG: ABC transporter ATP-binding protein [Alphaproteobacteria bacterium]|nr:ABC transporter ATP-binding protein [Alphaproteobacteria bacterium]
MHRPLVRLENVAKTFPDGLEALAGIDMEVGRGDFVSLLGPSGCGKSTLLRLIAGLAQPSGGQVLWPDGPPAPGRIGYVFQDPTLMPWGDVFDNVYLPLRIAGQGRKAARPAVEAALALVGLADFAHAQPHALSGGMRMRVSLARALVTRPALLLLDEPFGALDEITRFRLNDDLLRLWGEGGWTVLFVTHSVFEAVFLSQRVLIMGPRPGRIHAAIEIELPQPRPPELRMGADYQRICAAASASLAQAMGSC